MEASEDVEANESDDEASCSNTSEETSVCLCRFMIFLSFEMKAQLET
jgi:hypothetical protein